MPKTLNTSEWNFSDDPIPASKVNASQLDSELANLYANDEELNDWISQAIRDDGLLQSNLVRLFNLAPEVLNALISAAGWKPLASGAADLASTANLPLTGTVDVDGVTSGSGKRVLAKDQTDASENGLYVTSSGGAWTRATDADTAEELGYCMIPVTGGLQNARTTWLCTIAAADITVDATELAFVNLYQSRSLEELRELIPLFMPVQVVVVTAITVASPGTDYDGHTFATGDRLLLTAQADASENGPWVYAAGSLSRPDDYASGADVFTNTIIDVVAPDSRYNGTRWILSTTGAIVVDTTDTAWTLRAKPTNAILRMVYLASTSNVNVASAPASIDSITPGTNARILLTGQTAPEENGIWRFNGAAAAMTREPDDWPAEGVSVFGRMVWINAGRSNGNRWWYQSAPAIATNYIPGTTAATWVAVESRAASVSDLPRHNFLTNGRFNVQRRPTYVASVSGTYGYGKADRWKGALTGTVVSGTLTTDNNTGVDVAPKGLKWESVTLTGAGKVTFRHYVEAKDGLPLNLHYCCFNAYLRHDIGSAKNVTVSLYSADIEDAFAAVTLEISTVISVASGTTTQIPLPIPFSNAVTKRGFMIQIEVDTGAISNKNITLMNAQLCLGYETPLPDRLEAIPYELEKRVCERFYASTFPDGFTPVQAGSVHGHLFPNVVGASATMRTAWRPPSPMVFRAATITTYNPEGLNAQVYNRTDGADCSAISTTGSDHSAIQISFTTSAGAAAGELMDVHITVDRDV